MLISSSLARGATTGSVTASLAESLASRHASRVPVVVVPPEWERSSSEVNLEREHG